MLPSTGSSNRRMVLPRVDLPHPLSPTSPTVSPWPTSNDTPSTALIARPRVTYRVRNPSTDSSDMRYLRARRDDAGHLRTVRHRLQRRRGSTAGLGHAPTARGKGAARLARRRGDGAGDFIEPARRVMPAPGLVARFVDRGAQQPARVGMTWPPEERSHGACSTMRPAYITV